MDSVEKRLQPIGEEPLIGAHIHGNPVVGTHLKDFFDVAQLRLASPSDDVKEEMGKRFSLGATLSKDFCSARMIRRGTFIYERKGTCERAISTIN